MKISWVKYAQDDNSFKWQQTLGWNVINIEDLEKVDEKLKQLVQSGYRTIVITDEVASFSEDMIKTYPYQKEVHIIIAPR